MSCIKLAHAANNLANKEDIHDRIWGRNKSVANLLSKARVESSMSVSSKEKEKSDG